jgi:hypothetical protein
MANPNQEARDGKGRYIRTLEAVEQDAEIARRYSQGSLTFKEIGNQLGISKWAAISGYRRAVREVIQDAGHEALRVQIDRMEYLFAKAAEVLEAEHVVVSHGKVITMPDPDSGEEKPLRDHAPVLAAIREARQCLEAFQSLTGMKQPTKIEHSGGVTYELIGIQPEDVV